MKKILIFLLLWVVFIFTINFALAAWSCNYTQWDIKWSLNWCLSSTHLVNPWNDVSLDWGFLTKVNWIIKTIASILSLWAILWIVYGSFLLVVNWWEDEKIKKWKDVIKWSIIGFLWVVLASSIIFLVVTLFYDIGK